MWLGCLAEKHPTKPRATEESYEMSGDQAYPLRLPSPPSGMPPSGASPHRTRPRVPEATAVTNYGGVGDTFMPHVCYGPTPPSHLFEDITMPYSPPMFLG